MAMAISENGENQKNPEEPNMIATSHRLYQCQVLKTK